MNSYETLVFVDEVEIEENKETNRNVVIYYNGVCLDRRFSGKVLDEVHDALEQFGLKGFHAQRIYKRKDEVALKTIESLHKIILNYKLIWCCGYFAKKEMKKNLTTDLKWKLGSSYRAVGLSYFVHGLSVFIRGQGELRPKVRTYVGQDVLQAGEGFEPEFEGLEKVIFTTIKRCPLIALADHLGYLFQIVMKYMTLKDGKMEVNEEIEGDDFALFAWSKLNGVHSAGLFYNINLVQ